MAKLFLTAFVMVLIPAYLHEYGIQNFLWFSDISLLLILSGLWLSSSLLISIAALLTLFLEISWTIDYFYQLITGDTLINLASYMFDQRYSLFLRGLSLFHLLLPIFSIRYLWAWGYNKQTLKYAVPLYGVVLIFCYLFTSVQENINWVYLPQAYSWTNISSLQWLCLQLILYPLLIMLPKHLLFQKIFKKNNQSEKLINSKVIIRYIPPITLQKLQNLQIWLKKAG